MVGLQKEQLELRVFFVLGKRGYVLKEAFSTTGISCSYQSKYSGPRRIFGVIYEVVSQIIQHKKKPHQFIITDSVEYVPVAWLLAKLFRMKLIIRIRGDVWAEFNQENKTGSYNASLVKLLIYSYEGVLMRADNIVPVCDYLSLSILENTSVNSKKIKKIPISVMCDSLGFESRIEAKESLRLESKRILLSVTNFGFPQKVDRILHYLPVLVPFLEEDVDLLYVIAGGGAYLEEFKKKVKDEYESVASQLIFLGHVDDMFKLYIAADLVLYFSALDALPRAVIEAQAAGRVVLADDFAGIPEIIEHGQTGYLLKHRAELTTAIEELLINNELREKIEHQSADNAKRKFSPHSIGLLWRDYLESLNSDNYRELE